MRLHSILILAALPCASAQSTISAPVIGYAYDPGLRAIRSVRGIPGAATLGDTLHTGFLLTAASVAPLQNYALALYAEQNLRLIRWSGAHASSHYLNGAIARPDRIVFSPSGAAAILYDTTSAHMQFLTGLPDTPSLREIQPAGAAAVSAMAISDDATVVLASGGGVSVIGPHQNPVPLSLPNDIAALSFRASTDDLLAATPSGDVYLARNVNGAAAVTQIYAGDSRTSNPVAVQFSPDGAAAFLANTAGTLATIDLNTGSTGTLACQCTPTGLQPFGRAGLFRLTGISRQPLWLFDGTPDSSRIWFVPAEAPRNAQ